MKNLYLALLLVFVLAVSGCVSAEKKAAEGTKEVSAPEQNVSPVVEQPAQTEVPAETAPQETVQKVPKIIDAKSAAQGKNPALTVYGKKLWISSERFNGANEDLYTKTFDGKDFGSDTLVAGTDYDDIQPTSVSYLGNLYVFFTQTLSRSQTATIYYKVYNGNSWGNISAVGDLDYIFYYHNSSAVFFEGNALLFWTKGKRTDYGFISSRLLKKDYWFDGITITAVASVTDDKNPKAAMQGKDLFILYENFVPNGERNDIYIKRYANGFLGTGVKLTADSKNKFKSSGALASYKDKLYAIWVEKSSADGIIWGDVVRLTQTEGLADEPYLAEFNGDLYIAYAKYQGDAPFVYLGKLDV